LASSPEGRLSVSTIDVAEGQEDAFLSIAREFSVLMAKKKYGRTDIARDELSPNTFYAVRHWASASAAEACHADPEVGALTSRLYQIARVTHVVNGVRRLTPTRLIAADRRAAETDRRAGFDRRLTHEAPPQKADRRHRERRLGPRRISGRAGHIDLAAAARRARENADARFSNFKVGAALETASGSVITGCNVENATYGLTICAERVAMFKAISEGHRAFTRIAIVAARSARSVIFGKCASTPLPAPPV
jgi:homotetrameric cytidine deaminase